MKRIRTILPLLICLLCAARVSAAPTARPDIPELVRAYTYLDAKYGPQFVSFVNGCSDWAKDFCTFQRQLEKHSQDLAAAIGFTKHIASIPEGDKRPSDTSCFFDCTEKDTLFLSSPLTAVNGNTIAVVSSTSPWRTWVLSIHPDLSLDILYDSYDEKTWSRLSPRNQIGSVESAKITDATLHLVQDKNQEHKPQHEEYLLQLK